MARPIAPEDSGAEAMGAAVPSTTTLTMTSGHTAASLDLTPKDSNGTFAASSSDEKAQFGVTTNNYTGYTLTISGSDNTRQLTNSEVNTAKLDSITSSIDENTFNVSTSFNGRWGYQPSKYNSVANTDFLPSPTTTATTLDTTAVANASDANTYTIGLGARVDYTKPAGTYSNTFVLTAVGNPALYTISYLDNTGDTSVANLPAGASSATSETNVVLSSQRPTRNGYTFRAWCDGTVSGTANNPGITCTGTEYAAGANFGVDQTSTNVSSLYAVWDPIEYRLAVNFSGYPVTSVQIRTAAGEGGTLMGTVTASGGTVGSLVYNNTYYLYPVHGDDWSITSWANTGTAGEMTCNPEPGEDEPCTDENPAFKIGLGDGDVTITGRPHYMQNLSKSMCQTLASNDALTVTDMRDNRDYTVRYIGGTCWMTANLMYGYDATNGADNPNPGVSTLTLDPATSNVTSARTLTTYDLVTHGTNTEGANECYGSYNSTTQTGSGPGYVNACIHSGGNEYSGHTSDPAKNQTVWYNYAIASAGTITSKDNTDITGNMNTATESVCPKGWTLPSKKQIDNIGGASPGSTTYITSFSPVLGGGQRNGTLYDEARAGVWWTSETYNNTLRYILRYNGDNLYNSYNRREDGYYIRCVSEEKTVTDLTYLQDMTGGIVNNRIGRH